MSRRDELVECKVFVGGLPHDATTQELEETFGRYGPIRKVWMARRPPGFAFIEFEDSRDADDAVKGLNGARICGVRPRVEISHGRRRGGGGGGRGSSGGYRGDNRRRSRSPYHAGRSNSRSRSPPPRRSSPQYDEPRRSRSYSR